MGVFSRHTTVPVEGVIDRIGLASIIGDYFTYWVKLVGDHRWYYVQSIIGPERCVRIALTTAKPGDHVKFGIPNKDHGNGAKVVAEGFFDNLTLSDPTMTQPRTGLPIGAPVAKEDQDMNMQNVAAASLEAVVSDEFELRMPGPAAMDGLLSGPLLHERIFELMRLRARFDYTAWNRRRYSAALAHADAQTCIGIAFEDMPDLLRKAGIGADHKELASEFLSRSLQARAHLAEAFVPKNWIQEPLSTWDGLGEKWRELCAALGTITDRRPLFGIPTTPERG